MKENYSDNRCDNQWEKKMKIKQKCRMDIIEYYKRVEEFHLQAGRQKKRERS